MLRGSVEEWFETVPDSSWNRIFFAQSHVICRVRNGRSCTHPHIIIYCCCCLTPPYLIMTVLHVFFIVLISHHPKSKLTTWAHLLDSSNKILGTVVKIGGPNVMATGTVKSTDFEKSAVWAATLRICPWEWNVKSLFIMCQHPISHRSQPLINYIFICTSRLLWWGDSSLSFLPIQF